MNECAIKVTPELSAKIANISAICAFMVVVLHTGSPIVQGSSGWFLSVVLKGFAKSSVPFFFIVSGFFLAGHIGECGWWKREVVKRFHSLLIPFWEWGVIWWVYLLVIGLVSDIVFGRPLGSYLPEQVTLDKLWQGIGIDLFKEPMYSVTWYLRSLFVYVVAAPMFVAGLKRLGWMLIAALYCIDPWGLCKCGTGVMELFHGVSWFALGLGLRKKLLCVPTISQRTLIFCGVGAMAAVALRTGLLYMQFNLPFSLLGVIIPPTLLSLWGLVSERPFAKFVISVSMPVYLLHTFFISFFRIIFRPNEDLAIVNLAELLFAYCASLCMANLLSFLCPRMIKILFGRR